MDLSLIQNTQNLTTVLMWSFQFPSGQDAVLSLGIFTETLI